MTEAQLHAHLVQQFPGQIGQLYDVSPEEQHIRIAPQALHSVCDHLLHTPQLHFDFLRQISLTPGSDRWTALYYLYSFEHGHAIVLRVDVPRNIEQFNSVEDLWPAADQLEHEAELRLGVRFAAA
jgi:Ni,Fe-hydrogenase III component G